MFVGKGIPVNIIRCITSAISGKKGLFTADLHLFSDMQTLWIGQVENSIDVVIPGDGGGGDHLGVEALLVDAHPVLWLTQQLVKQKHSLQKNSHMGN